MTHNIDPATSGTAAFPKLLGFTNMGRPVFEIRGAEGDPDPGTGDGTDTDKPDDTGVAKPDGSKPDDEKKFSQEEVNAIVAREANKAQRGKLDPSELGFQSGKELKEFLEKAKATEEQNKTDAEKALEEATEKAKKDAEAGVLTKAQNISRRAEFKLQAIQNQVDPKYTDQAFTLAHQLDEWANVEVDDDGVVTGLDEAFFVALKEHSPFLFTEASGDGSGDIGARSGSGGKSVQSPEERREELSKTYKALRTTSR